MLLRVLFMLALLIFSRLGLASPEQPSHAELDNLRQAIQAAQTDLQHKQAAQKNTQHTLNQARQQLNRTQQDLHQLQQQQRHVANHLNTLQSELESLKTKVVGAQAQLTRLLNGQYKNRQSHTMIVLLNQTSPNQKARYLEYARYIYQANQQVVKNLRRQQSELKQRESAIDRNLTRLQQLKQQKQNVVKQLHQTTAEAQQEHQQLNSKIQQQQQYLARLRADEAKLNQIVGEISRRHAIKRKQEAAMRSQAATQRLAQAAKAKPTVQMASAPEEPEKEHKPSEPVVLSTLTDEDRALQAPYENQAANSFSKLQGRLAPPIHGTISGRFGQARPNGGAWRGVFYATAPSTVRSIAAGTVAYAGKLNSYGNTIVIDHGNDYTSIYTGLSSIGVGNGSGVKAGSVLGSSGSLASGEQGLYFEIRYRNSAMNPLSWLR